MITRDEAQRRFRGTVVPIVTVFQHDWSLDLEATASNVKWIIDRGARHGNTVFLVAGSGGDFTSMNVDERKAVIKAVVEVTAGRVPIIAGAQSLDVRDCIAICQHCEDLGVDAVQISGPYYYGGRPGDVVAWLEEVARHTRIGFALYNNWYTGYNMPLELIDRLLEIPNSIAVKWSSPDYYTFEDGIRRWVSQVAVVDNSMLPVKPYILGCRAFVSQVPHFYPEYIWRVWDLLEQHHYDEAQRLFDDLMVPYFELIGQIEKETGGEGVEVRAAMAAVGLEVGRSRLPSRDEVVTPEIQQGFRQLFIRLGALSVV